MMQRIVFSCAAYSAHDAVGCVAVCSPAILVLEPRELLKENRELLASR